MLIALVPVRHWIGGLVLLCGLLPFHASDALAQTPAPPDAEDVASSLVEMGMASNATAHTTTVPLPATARAAVLYYRPSAARSRTFSDRWLARDKALHVTYSFLWTLSSQYVLVEKTPLSHDAAIPYALASGFAVGVAKETYDRYWGPTGRFSWRDMVANGIGLGLAAGVMVL